MHACFLSIWWSESGKAILSSDLDIRKLLQCQGFPFCSAQVFLLLRRPPLNLSIRRTGVHQRALKGSEFHIKVEITIVSIYYGHAIWSWNLNSVQPPTSLTFPTMGTRFFSACRQQLWSSIILFLHGGIPFIYRWHNIVQNFPSNSNKIKGEFYSYWI